MDENTNVDDRCGIIMPIAAWGSFTEEYWKKILSFVSSAIKDAGMTPIPAWEDKKNDVIHAKIIENIASLPVMIGVIVGCNPNVMLECGMRLWTNKPILLIYGDGEKIPFDVGGIQCLRMPANCDYFEFVSLKKEIVEKLKHVISDEYRTFKSYYNVTNVVEEPEGIGSVKFEDFVKEVRGTITRLNEDLVSLRNDMTMMPLSYGYGAVASARYCTSSPALSAYASSVGLVDDATSITGASKE